MRNLIRLVLPYLAAVLTAYVLASILVTQHVLARVAEMGVEVSLAVRASSTVHDIVGMATSYLPLIAIGFAIGLPVAALLTRKFSASRSVLFAAAGAVAIVTVNLALTAAFDIVTIASARSLPGLLAQGAAGAVGGVLFSRLAVRH